MSAIRSLKPNVSRDEAVARLEPAGLQGFFRSWTHGPLRSLAEVYIPYRLFEVEITNGGKRDRRWLALDAVSGALDLYAFDSVAAASETIPVETRNCVPAQLDGRRACELVAESVRRLIFQTGFFRVRELSIDVRPLPVEFHVPYWVGFFGRGPQARIAVLDAVRRSLEGAKARALLADWLAA